jgi:hypothetical protein
MTTIIEKIRNLIEDNLITTGRDVFDYESIVSSKIFTLTEANVNTSTIIVKKNGTVWAVGNYSFNSGTCELTIIGTLAAGDSLAVTYSYYAKYSDNEIIGRIKAAISYLSVEKYGTFAIKEDNVIFPTPDEQEENLIAIVASILIKGDVVSYRTPEFTITFERGESKEKKIKQCIRQSKKAYGVLQYIKLDLKTVDQDSENNL